MRDFNAELGKDIQKILTAIPEIVRDAQAYLVGFAINDLVQRSNPFVQSTAYRAAHAVGVGSPGGGPPDRLVYDSPDHPEPDVDYKPGEQEFQPPDGAEARHAFLQEKPFQCAILFNDRHYADQVEYGWPSHEGYAVYAAAEAATTLQAESLPLILLNDPRLK